MTRIMDDLAGVADGAGCQAGRTADIRDMAFTVEADMELLNCLDTIGMFAALESASKLLPSAVPRTTASPVMLLILAWTEVDGSEDSHF